MAKYIFAIGEEFNLGIADGLFPFQVKKREKTKSGNIYFLVVPKGYDYSGKERVMTENALNLIRLKEESIKQAIKTCEEEREYFDKVISSMIKTDLPCSATFTEIASWIWDRGHFGLQVEDNEPDGRFIDYGLKTKLDTICASATVYKYCLDYFPALKELNNWHDLSRVADGCRNPRLPKINQYSVYIEENGYLDTITINAIEMNETILKKEQVSLEKVLFITETDKDYKKKIIWRKGI